MACEELRVNVQKDFEKALTKSKNLSEKYETSINTKIAWVKTRMYNLGSHHFVYEWWGRNLN